jgi:hypothetical protein
LRDPHLEVFVVQMPACGRAQLHEAHAYGKRSLTICGARCGGRRQAHPRQRP